MKKTTKIRISKALTLGLNIALCFGTFNIPIQTKAAETTVSNNATALDVYYAKTSEKSVVLHTDVLTESNSERLYYYEMECQGNRAVKDTQADYGAVSELTQFTDYKGYINIAYSDSKYVYIHRYTKSLQFVSEIKINKKYPLLGDVVNDKYGNYYVVWGKEDESYSGGGVTMAVTKYSYSGNYIKEATYVTTKGDSELSDTCCPFEYGNCSTIIKKDGTLVCSYARTMHNGHQSNHVLCVDTDAMTLVENYKNYVSHSFDQRVIELNDGGVCFVNKGDAYPRGFDVEFFDCDRLSDTTFHFYGALGDNNVYASLGGVVEVNDNVFLVGASAKSMTETAGKEGQNLFIQLVGSDKTISGGVNRKGTCCGKNTEDTGIKWLTNYTGDYTVSNPQTVEVGGGKFAVMWEKIKNDSFVESYYMIIDSNGGVAQKATRMNNARLNAHEDPIYSDGYIYWATAGKIGEYITDRDRGILHKLHVGKRVKILTTPKLTEIYSDSKGVTVKWNKIAGADKYRIFRRTQGKNWTKITDTNNTIFIDKSAKKGTKYSYTIRCVDMSGKEYTSDYNKSGKTIKPVNDPKITKITNENSGIKITWGKVKYADKYRLYRKLSNGKWTKVCDISKNYYVDKQVKSGSYCSYKIMCVDQTGKIRESGISTIKSIRRLAQPQITKVTQKGKTFTLKWDKVAGAKSYNVYRKTGKGKWKKIKTVKTNSYKDTKLDTSKNYYTFYVKAVNGNNHSSNSDIHKIKAGCDNYVYSFGDAVDWSDWMDWLKS